MYIYNCTVGENVSDSLTKTYSSILGVMLLSRFLVFFLINKHNTYTCKYVRLHETNSVSFNFHLR